MPSVWFRLLVHNAAPPSLHGVREGPFPRFHAAMRCSDSPPSVSTRFEFFTSQYHRFARGLLPSAGGVPPGARELSVPVSPSGIAMETSGALRFLENPDGHCPCSTTPVGPDAPCGTKCDAPDAAPACVQDEGSKRLVFSGLNHTTFDLAVYASQGGLPHHHARLASGRWSGSTRRDSYPQGFNERFHIFEMILLSRASWRKDAIR